MKTFSFDNFDETLINAKITVGDSKFDNSSNKQQLEEGRYLARAVAFKIVNMQYKDEKPKTGIQYIFAVNSKDNKSTYYFNHKAFNLQHVNSSSAFYKELNDIYQFKINTEADLKSAMHKVLDTTVALRLVKNKEYLNIDRIIDVSDQNIEIVNKEIPNYLSKFYSEKPVSVYLEEGFKFREERVNIKDSISEASLSLRLSEDFAFEASKHERTSILPQESEKVEPKEPKKIDDVDSLFQNLNS